MAYYYTTNNTIWTIVLFLLVIQSGAITYKMHEALKGIIPKEKNSSKVKNRKSRNNVQHENSLFDVGQKTWGLMRPESGLMRTITIIGMVLNLIVGILLFFWLALRLVGPISPTVTGVGLISLPLLMFAMMTSSIIWTS